MKNKFLSLIFAPIIGELVHTVGNLRERKTVYVDDTEVLTSRFCILPDKPAKNKGTYWLYLL
jgi:hypothetical protein